MKFRNAILISLLFVLLDQISKIYIKTHFALHDGVKVFDWFWIYFIENNGAAWGFELPGLYGKIALVLFRIFAIVFIFKWLYEAVKAKGDKLLIASIILIFAGAIGNTIDSVFYGMIFDDSRGVVATFFSENPYSGIFRGKVVDMLYFPMIDTKLPEWLPFFGGDRFTFFDPVFNMADVFVSTAVGMLIVFHKRAFNKDIKIF